MTIKIEVIFLFYIFRVPCINQMYKKFWRKIKDEQMHLSACMKFYYIVAKKMSVVNYYVIKLRSYTQVNLLVS
jgi:hypothetical protein